MESKGRRPQWWQLYIALPVLVSLFWPETRAALSETEHIFAEFGILVLIFAFVHLWLRANRSALLESDTRDAGWGVRIYELPMERLRDMEQDEECLRARPGLQITASHKQGVLSGTFARDLPEDAASVFAYRSTVLRKE